MGSPTRGLCALIAVLAAACASGDTGGGEDDAAVVDPPDAAVAIDAGLDAGEPVGTCEPCTANSNCIEGHLCVLIGGDRACLPGCSEDDPTCPDGFTCGGVKTTFCAPDDGLCCVDGDDDGYGVGVHCDGVDCDDTNGEIHPGADDICNGDDDDCNGLTEDGSGDPDLGADCDGDDVDLCEEGVYFCDVGALQCGDSTGDNLDLCNGMDDDCDPATLDGSADPAFGTACDSTGDPDLCFDDQNICDSVGGAIVCQDMAGGAVDLCNGLDDDCNPATNDGDGDPAVGVPCDGIDADLCSEGTTYCAGGTVLCDDPNTVNAELCNGFDDDCNPGTLDGSQDPLVGPDCDGSDTDLCEEGTWVCNSGLVLCTDTSGNDVEICNGADDDCDSIVDDLDPAVVCPGQYPGAGNVSSWACSGDCVITACSTDFADVDTLVSTGCECGPVDTYADSCAGAGAGAGITLAAGATIDMTGYIDVPGISDYLKVNFVAPAMPGEWTPRIELVSIPAAGFNMDVLDSSCVVAVCDTDRDTTVFEESASDVDTWEQGYLAANYGTVPTDKTAKPTTVIVRVYRSAGDAVCSTYQVRITNSP